MLLVTKGHENNANVCKLTHCDRIKCPGLQKMTVLQLQLCAILTSMWTSGSEAGACRQGEHPDVHIEVMFVRRDEDENTSACTAARRG